MKVLLTTMVFGFSGAVGDIYASHTASVCQQVELIESTPYFLQFSEELKKNKAKLRDAVIEGINGDDNLNLEYKQVLCDLIDIISVSQTVVEAPGLPDRVETHKLAVLSTSHLQPADSEILDSGIFGVQDCGQYLFYTALGNDVFFEQCLLKQMEKMTPSFRDMVVALRDQGYGYILFDPEAVEYPELFPIFDF